VKGQGLGGMEQRRIKRDKKEDEALFKTHQRNVSLLLG